MRLDGVRFALSGGLTWGIAIVVATLSAYFTGYGASMLQMLEVYPGYGITLAGAGVGFVWAFLKGFVLCGLFAWLYNHIHRYSGKTYHK